MKKLIFLVLIPFLIGAQQVRHLNIEQLFDGTKWEDFIVTEEDKYTDDQHNRFDLVHVESDTALDTMVTRVIPNVYGDKCLYFTVLSDSADTTASGAALADTINAYLDMGVFRGYGTVPGSAAGVVDSSGYEWKNLWHVLDTDTSIRISLNDSTWFTEEPTPQYKYRIRELGTYGTDKQRNEYYLNEFSFYR